MYFLFSSYFKYFPICYGPIREQELHGEDSDHENTIPVNVTYLGGTNRFKLLGMMVSMTMILHTIFYSFTVFLRLSFLAEKEN